MKVYVCWTIPDYIGISIEAIFAKEDDARKFCQDYNKNHPDYDCCDYDEFGVQ